MCNSSGTFGAAEAKVLCRQLGLGSRGVATNAALWDPAALGASAPARAWLDGVACTGSEPRLEQCALPGWGASCGPEGALWLTCSKT